MGIRNDVPDDYVADDSVTENPFTAAELDYLINPQKQEVHHMTNGIEDAPENEPLEQLMAEIQTMVDAVNNLCDSLQPTFERIQQQIDKLDALLK